MSHGKTQGDLLTSNVAGFIYVTEVDMMQKKFTYLSPCAGDLPSNVFGRQLEVVGRGRKVDGFFN